MNSIYDNISKQFEISDWKEQHKGQYFFKVKKIQARSLITHLRDVLGFGHLVFFTAIDHIEQGKFHLLYMLHNYKENIDLGLTVEIGRDGEEMDSIHDLWAAASTYQQEIREMYGVEFPGSPGLHDNFVLEGWEDIPPMRREFDSKEFSEKTYYPRPGRKTQDNRENMKEKLYPSEAETW